MLYLFVYFCREVVDHRTLVAVRRQALALVHQSGELRVDTRREVVAMPTVDALAFQLEPLPARRHLHFLVPGNQGSGSRSIKHFIS